MTEVHTTDLQTTTRIVGQEARCVVSGEADTADKAALDAYLRALHELATSRSLAVVEIDFRGLMFMSSSCFKLFVLWVGMLEDEIAPERRYRVRFVTGPRARWQARSVGALRCAAPDFVDVAS